MGQVNLERNAGIRKMTFQGWLVQ